MTRSSRSRRLTVLVVDDEVDQAESWKLVLEAARPSWRVKTALTVDSAYLMAGTHPPDVVVLDWLLPGGGPAFVTGLRAAEGMEGLPVVVVTGLPLTAVSGLDGLPRIALR